MQRKLLCIVSVGLVEAAGQLLIIYCAFIKYWKEKMSKQWSSASAVY